MTTATQVRTTPIGKVEMPEIFRGLKVIDVDTHFAEPPDLWTSRAPEKYRDMVPQVRRVGEQDSWFWMGQPMGPVSVTIVGRGRQKHYGAMTLDRYEQVDPASYDAKERVRLMDDVGLWAQIVYPNTAGFGGNTFAIDVPNEVRNMCARIYNDAIAEAQRESGNRFLPQAIMPFWDIEESCREVRRAVEELGLTGIAAPSAPEEWGLPDFGEEVWNPFWEVVTGLDVPINFHIGGVNLRAGNATGAWPSFTKDVQSAVLSATGTRAMASVAIGGLTLAMANCRVLINLLFSGLLERWPKLKFVSVESGMGWIPFFLEMAEYSFDEMTPENRWGLKKRPREYFQQSVYVTWWFEDYGPRHMIDLVGVNNILFETDFPHPTCLYPHPLAHAAEVLKDHPEHVRRRIMQDNAAELYKIPV